MNEQIDYKFMDSIEKGAKIGKSREVRPQKVYCRNCIYYWTSRGHIQGVGYIPIERYCLYPKNKTIKKNFEGTTVFNFKNVGNPEVKNVNNNCINYKRKWWKFWV
jgi:hypothetical protein